MVVMVPDFDMSGKLETMEVSPTLMEKNSVKLPEENMMICASNCEDGSFSDVAIKASEKGPTIACSNNCEDSSFHMEASPSGHDNIMASKGKTEDVEVDIIKNVNPDEERSPSGHDNVMASKGKNEDVEVDIIENVNPDEERLAGEEPQEVTESSSSFGCTDSGDEGAGTLSDTEVESEVRDSKMSLLGLDGFGDLFRTRKKKVTPHWRKFIRPLMWRCKWVELKIRELNSQARKYDRELAEFEKRKQCQIEKGATKELGTKSAPFICQNRTAKMMKRKKRKRVEQTEDLAPYTSCHNLFSYYVKRRPAPGSAYMDDDSGNTDVVPAEKRLFGNDEWTSFVFKDSIAFESVLRKIEEAQLQVHQLRGRIDRVVREISGNVAPDMVEATDQPQIGEKCEKMESNILINNQPVKEELNIIEEIGNQHIAEPQLAAKGKGVEHVAVPNSTSKMPVIREHSTLKMRSVSKLNTRKNTKKRGKRKRSKWSRRSSG